MSLTGVQVPRGYQRWERARLNAERNPDSPGAKLYRTRRELARKVWEQFAMTGPHAFDFYRHKYGTQGNRTEIDFRTDSVECAAMELQLRYGSVHPLQLGPAIEIFTAVIHDKVPHHYVAHNGYRPDHPIFALHDPQRQTKTVRCHVCNTEMHPQGVAPRAEDNGDAYRLTLMQEELRATQAQLQLTEVANRTLMDQLNAVGATASEHAARVRREIDARIALEERVRRMTKEREDEQRVTMRMIDTESLKDLYYIKRDGAFVPALDLLVVQLDDDQLTLLNDYCDLAGRRRYRNDNGNALRTVF